LHDANADFSIRSNRDKLSNSTDSRNLHIPKLDSFKTITDDGITTDFNLHDANADFSIRSNRESLSNSTYSSDSQFSKLDSFKTITDDGITIDLQFPKYP
jgi:hypothetical protein